MKKILALSTLLFFFTIANAQTSGSITVQGDFDKFYPVTFEDGGWFTGGPTTLNLGRPDVHTNSNTRGSLMSKFTYHVTRWGHNSSFIDADVMQSLNSFSNGGHISVPFIAGWDDATRNNPNASIVVWLRGGGTTYTFVSNYACSPVVYDGVANALPFAELNGPSRTYKTAVDSYVNSFGLAKSGSIYVASTTPSYFAGNVSIGTQNAQGYKLAVAGGVIAESVKVKLQGAWPDYVFAKNYQLPTLSATEQFIKENGHLPGIPSAKEVAANGIDVEQMNAKLLQKLEELTLHLIDLKKENEQMKAEIKSLKRKK